MNKRWQLVQTGFQAFLLVGLVVALGACGKRGAPTATLRPAPTPLIRHRDAYPLLLTGDDLGDGYKIVEMYRLERGKGWGDDTTRLSGYRHVYRGGVPFSPVICQVECYLSVKDAQTAYRAYKEKRVADLKADGQYTFSESETYSLGEWGTVLNMREREDENREVFTYLFVRENVFAEVTLAGHHSLDFIDRTLRQAQVLDQRIAAR